MKLRFFNGAVFRFATLAITCVLAALLSPLTLAVGADATNSPAPVLPPTSATIPASTPASTPATADSNGATTTPAAPINGLSYDSFRLVAERNIFNPNRFGRATERETTRREPERRARTESIALVGTMSYEQGHFAFFDGSDANYRRVLKRADTIAGLTVASVTPQHVILRASGTNENEITLPLGMQLQRHDEGKWEVTKRPEVAFANGPLGSSSAASAGSTSIPGEENDVVKRMMQQREQDSPPPLPATETAPSADPDSSIHSSNSNNSTNTNPGSAGAESDVLRRLMQRREKGE
jgi:hypothetical protein